jgi:hypothetical protein
VKTDDHTVVKDRHLADGSSMHEVKHAGAVGIGRNRGESALGVGSNGAVE